MCATRWPAPRPRTRHGTRRNGPGVLGEAPCRLRHVSRRPMMSMYPSASRDDTAWKTDRPVMTALARILRRQLERTLQHTELECTAGQRAPGVKSRENISPPTSLLASATTPRELGAPTLPVRRWQGASRTLSPPAMRKLRRRNSPAETRKASALCAYEIWVLAPVSDLGCVELARTGLRPSHRRVPP